MSKSNHYKHSLTRIAATGLFCCLRCRTLRPHHRRCRQRHSPLAANISAIADLFLGANACHPSLQVALDHTTTEWYQYSTDYSEFHPTGLKPHTADEQQRLVPNTAFSYSMSPLRIIHRSSTQSLGSLLTQLCAVVGGVFTTFGLIDSILFWGATAAKRD